MDVCLRVLKESNKSRFDSYSIRNSVLIISHITFRDYRVHIFPTTFSKQLQMDLASPILPSFVGKEYSIFDWGIEGSHSVFPSHTKQQFSFSFCIHFYCLMQSRKIGRQPPGEGGGHSHTLPIRVCAAQQGRDFEAPDLERGIHFRGVFQNGV